MNQKHLALALFLSVGLNLFLLGSVVSRRMLHAEGPWHAKHEQPPHGPEGGAERKDRQHHGPRSARGLDHKLPSSAGDLQLLRSIVRVMGGPSDPRLKSLGTENRETVRANRKQMRDAHDKVEKALLTEPYDEAALKDAFQKLRAATSNAQEQAQAAVVQLSSLLTNEERQKLKDFKEKSEPPRRLHRGSP